MYTIAYLTLIIIRAWINYSIGLILIECDILSTRPKYYAYKNHDKHFNVGAYFQDEVITESQWKSFLRKLFSSFRGDSSDKILFGFLAVSCLCFIGIAFGFYIGNEELTETIETFMRIISHKETNGHKNHEWRSFTSHVAK